MKRWILFFVIIILKDFSIFASEKIRILHLSFHNGCIQDFNYVAENLGFDVTNWFISNISEQEYGAPRGTNRYNITHSMAEAIWDKNKEFFNEFDLVITSDTAPLARIFLQNNFSKPLIIWICNRFDYCDRQSLKETFPDNEYLNLIRSTNEKSNVKVISYTPFEYQYARKYYGINFGDKTIKPTGISWQDENFKSLIPYSIKKESSFFIPNYHNDAILPSALDSLSIPYYKGRYSGPDDLKDFKGIIHIPYAWSNLALFENLSNGLIYFIPTKKFLLKLRATNNFYWSPPFDEKLLSSSEWYTPEHASLFVYFDSWKDLKQKIEKIDYQSLKEKIIGFSLLHKNKMLKEWNCTILSLTSSK